jgi:hypothetical protein
VREEEILKETERNLKDKNSARQTLSAVTVGGNTNVTATWSAAVAGMAEQLSNSNDRLTA